MGTRVELKRFPEPASAALVKDMLARKGIDAAVRYSGRYGGIRGAGCILSVSAADFDHAREILAEFDTGIDLDEYVSPDDTSYRRCPACRSVMIHRAPLAGRECARLVSTLGLGWFFMEKSFNCVKCGHEWRSR